MKERRNRLIASDWNNETDDDTYSVDMTDFTSRLMFFPRVWVDLVAIFTVESAYLPFILSYEIPNWTSSKIVCMK